MITVTPMRQKVRQGTVLSCRIFNRVLGNRGYKLESLKNCGDKKIRNDLIREIREITGESVRELSRYMEISKDMIFRA